MQAFVNHNTIRFSIYYLKDILYHTITKSYCTQYKGQITMIAIEEQLYPNPNRNKNNNIVFDVEWESLSQISHSSRFSERVSLYDDIRKSEDHFGKVAKTDPVSEREKSVGLSKDWAKSLGNDRFDLILTASSLTEGSCLSLHSEFDDILSTVPFDEETVNSSDSMNTNDEEDDESVQSLGIPNQEMTKKDIRIRTIDYVQEFKERRSVSYAQLFFNPETEALGTLMEIPNNIQPSRRRHTTSRNKIDKDTRGFSNLEQRKSDHPRGIPLHQYSALLLKSHIDNSIRQSAVKRDGDHTKEWNLDQDEDDSPFQDETLSTECSSLSSATFRKHDHNHCEDDWDFTATLLYPASPTRFSDEPIVFSNDSSMDQKLSWLNEADICLYLLQDCDDPWDHGGSNRRGNARCGNSIKKLLNASRHCISLPQLGESKWRASSTNFRTPSLSNGNQPINHHKAKLERMSYSILNGV